MYFRMLLFICVLVGVSIYHSEYQKCKDAGGVYAPNVCVNPSAIIELD
jgi:hypothetical protein